MNIFVRFWQWLFPKKEKLRLVDIIEADTPPELIKGHNLVLARDGGEDWAVAFLCPCGCKERLELALIPEVRPNWTLKMDDEGLPTLRPSVWRKTGCRSHFWVRNGLIIWCEE